MSSVIEKRVEIIQQNVPKLIKSLTGFKTGDENFQTISQFCFNRFKNHRFLTVNSHEIKRDVDGICEKLRFSNLHDIERKFRNLVEQTLSHELSENHYEKDCVYAIVNLLINLSYDPISKLKDKIRKGQSIVVYKADIKKAPSTRPSDTVISSLLKDNFKLQKHETDSELSEWTDSDVSSDLETSSNESSNESCVQPVKNASTHLQPPGRQSSIKTELIEKPMKWLSENIQNSWWRDEISSVGPVSSHPAANFCKLWQKNLSDKSMGFLKPTPISLVNEYCLLREIFWMFMNPTDCKFFQVNEHEIVLRADVTLPSTMQSSLQLFLADLVRSINLMERLKSGYKKSYQTSTSTHVTETYYNVVNCFLDQILEFILDQEAIVKAQQENYTIVILNKKLYRHANMLEMLWDIHCSSVLDASKYPPHICSSYLLASLHNHVIRSCVKEKKNIALVLLIFCLKVYFDIFETWWSNARLEDIKSEFLMENYDQEEAQITQPRLFVKSKEKSFFLSDAVSNLITSDRIINSMLNYSMKASFTFDTISKLDRIHEMRNTIHDSPSFYEEFRQRVQREIEKFSQKKNCEDTDQKNQKLVEDFRDGTIVTNPHDSSMFLFNMLQSASEFMLLPLEHNIQKFISEILEKKVSVAENFVMDIYSHEFDVEHHLKSIREVFFLESTDLTNFFHLKLFPQIDDFSCSSTSSDLLTLALSDAICSSSKLFSVNFTGQVHNLSVLGAIDTITIHFNISKDLSNVFSKNAMKKYNEVFRFLLKIKWGQRLLSCIKFPSFFKRRIPYSKLRLIDLIIKRLSLTRFAMLHSVNTLHNNVMIMLQGLSMTLDTKIAKTRNVSELILFHDCFVEAVYEKSCLGEDSLEEYGIIIQMLKLAKVLEQEWTQLERLSVMDGHGRIDTTTLDDHNRNSIQIEEAFAVCEYRLKMLLDA